MTSPNDERRRSLRVDAALKLEVKLPVAGGSHEVANLETLNISSSGVYFRSDHYIEPMTKLNMEIELPMSDGDDAAASTAACEGIVVRVIPEFEADERETYEVAVFFTRIDDDGIERLQDHISHLLIAE
jgi:PilZ domain